MRSTSIATVLAGLLSVSIAHAERLAVPLTDPGKPVQVEVSLVMGSIKVTGGGVREVVIDAKPREDGEAEGHGENRGGREGMRRIPNRGIGLEAEEENNKVTIGAESWARAIDLEIQVPAGTSLTLSTVNDGEIEVADIDGEVDANNTNGGMTIKNVKGPVSANTVNGDVLVAFRGPIAAKAMAFSTLNGDIDITLPANLKADVRLRSDNGEIYADFDIALDKNPPKIEEQK